MSGQDAFSISLETEIVFFFFFFFFRLKIIPNVMSFKILNDATLDTPSYL